MLRIFAIFLCLTSCAVQSEELTMVFHYPPGGPTDIFASSAIPSLTRDGVTVKKEYYKNCAAAVSAVDKATTPTVLVTVTGDFSYVAGTTYAKCPSQVNESRPLKPIRGIVRGELKLCTPPGSPITDFNSLIKIAKDGRKIKIGYSTSPVITGILSKFASLHPDISFVMLPYSGGAAMRVAVNAHDVDLFLQMAVPKELIDQGSVCIAMSAKGNKLPFIGEGSKTSFPDYYVSNFFMTNENIMTDSIATKIRHALTSPETLSTITNQMNSKFSDISPNELVKQISSYETEFLQ